MAISAQPRIVTQTVTGIAALKGAPCRLAVAAWDPQQPARGTVMAVHGLTRQKRDFDYIGAYLAQQGWRVLAVDVPGRGGSDWFEDPMLYDLGVYADIFANLIAQMNAGGVHWMGTSMGGLIAMEMAGKGHGALLRSLTLIDITPVPHAKGLARIASYVNETLPVFENRAQYAALLKQNLPLGDDVPEDVWNHYAQYQLVERSGGGFSFHFDPLIARAARPAFEKGVDLTAGMMKIACPVALVAGSVSDICTPEEIAALRATHPQAKVHMRQGAGHVPALEDTATQQFISDFIASA